MPWLEIGLVLVIVAAVATAIHYAKAATKEKARADHATEQLEVVNAYAAPVEAAKDLVELKQRAKKRRDRARALRKRSGH